MTKPLRKEPDIEPLTRFEILGYMAITAVILLVVSKIWIHFRSISLIPLDLTLKALGMGLGVGLIITVTSSIVYRVWPAYRQSADQYLAMVLSPLEWPDLMWLALLPGLSEELLFRGVFLSDFGLSWPAIIGSSAFFGVLHYSGKEQWPYVIWASVVGLFLGYSVLVTGNLFVPIVAHVLTNFISGLVWKRGR